MFNDADLQNHLETSSTVKTQSAIIAEWNLNSADNILAVGNYRFRPSDNTSIYNKTAIVDDATVVVSPHTTWALETEDTEDPYYYGATDSDVILDGGLTDDNQPYIIRKKNLKKDMLFSLEDCVGKFRPRSGINKMVNLSGRFLTIVDSDMATRPRYYAADKNDGFKYWTSSRNDNGTDRGISYKKDSNFFIDDTAPFVVYKEKLAANRIIVKMQTHVGPISKAYRNQNGQLIADPFGPENKTAPKAWVVEYLDGNTWKKTGVTLTDESVSTDGYVELAYGLKPSVFVAEGFDPKTIVFGPTYATTDLLPDTSIVGYAYLIQTNSTDKGTYYVFDGGTSVNKLENYTQVTPEYGWFQIADGTPDNTTPMVTELIKSKSLSFVNESSAVQYREFQELSGLRISVFTMNKTEETFDLIEMSPRLVVDLTERTRTFNIKKTMADVGANGMPVGNMVASSGSLALFDEDMAFKVGNTSSILNGFYSKNLQIKFYEVVRQVKAQDNLYYDYYVPLKTLYTEGFPQVNSADRTVELSLRDMYFYLESMIAPTLLVQQASLSFAVSMLLDSVGFSNYVFKRTESAKEAVIPYFFVGPDTNVAQVINDLAQSTQTAVFFDEYNNLVFMSKEYIMPSEDERGIDTTFIGTLDQLNETASSSTPNAVYQNKDVGLAASSGKLANIIDIKSKDEEIFNDGKIVYNTRYIQKDFSTIRQGSLLDRDKTWKYKPVVVWEVSGQDAVRAKNDEPVSQSGYSLVAIPLNSKLSKAVPSVVGGEVVNNVIDFGEALGLNLSRFRGYFQSNGEIIKFDAVEYNVTPYGNVWISNSQEYEYYFSKISFGGNMYITGRVRIYCEPKFKNDGTLEDGPVSKHGRGQFGTTPIDHNAGIEETTWTDPNFRVGFELDSKYLFDSSLTPPATTLGQAGWSAKASNIALDTNVSGKISNFMAVNYGKESSGGEANLSNPATVQASAMVVTGSGDAALENITYIYKNPADAIASGASSTGAGDTVYDYFGTRLRVIGKVDTSTQTPYGAKTFYNTSKAATPEQPVSVAGSSGGIAIFVDPSTNNGYYFELAALTATTVRDYTESTPLNNLFFYKVKKHGTEGNNSAIAIPLWSGLKEILVDDGRFTGQSRMLNEEHPTVYDLAIEYETIEGTGIRFRLYLNDRLIAVVDDINFPLPKRPNVALFVRGSSKVMFENIYALGADNVNSSKEGFAPSKTKSSSFRKYSMSNIIQSTYLSKIGTSQPPEFGMYSEEFGTIMRECDYMNIRFDKAYPAFISKMLPNLTGLSNYTISGFTSNAYGAEFLVFNNTDTTLSFDSGSGNFLKIYGITFTQQSQHELTVDDYFAKKTDFSSLQFAQSGSSTSTVKNEYKDIKNSRNIYGKKEFTAGGVYIQAKEDAEDIMGWIISKTMRPRKSVSVSLFAMPTLQLGDIVEIDYINKEGMDELDSTGSRYVVYSIEYQKSTDGPDMAVYLSEVV